MSASAREKLANLADAMVEDILHQPDEDVLLEALGERIEKLREERDRLKAALEKPTKQMLAAGAQALINAQAHNGVAQMAVFPAYEVWTAMAAAIVKEENNER